MQQPHLFRKNRPGVTGVGLVIGLVIVALVVIAVAYFWSDPFKTRVDRAITQATEWTPENIAADPSGYLTWAYGEMDSIEQQLKAREIRLRQLAQETERSAALEVSQQGRLSTALTQLKTGYREADYTGSWPMVHEDGRTLEETDARRLILEADKRLQQSQEKSQRYTVLNQRIERELQEVDSSITNLQSQRIDLGHQIELARLDQTLDGYDSLVDTVNSITDTSAALSQTSASELTLDDFIGEEQAIDEAEDRRFDQIMSEG